MPHKKHTFPKSDTENSHINSPVFIDISRNRRIILGMGNDMRDHIVIKMDRGIPFMDERLVDLRSSKNREARIKVMQGHFATQNSHINTYIDMSTVKCRQNNAYVSAKALAEEYMLTSSYDTIVCLDETEVIGAFLADELSHSYKSGLSYGNNISVITPEVNSMGQMIFRANKIRMVEGMRVLILTDSITSGKTILQAIDSVIYYGGQVCGIAAIFSAVSKCAGIEVKSIFSVSDVPNYGYYSRDNCPMCAAGQRIEALVNGFGYSKL